MMPGAMTAPFEPESAPEAQEEDQEIILRLGDILPRVPAHLLKPGPHDSASRVRFSVEELAEKIARGRVSVPLERLSSACPDVFRTTNSFLAQEEISLPLQKLLEQVGLANPKTGFGNGAIPKDQLAQARAQASRILEASAPAPPPPPPSDPPASPPVQSFRISKAIATARQILGVFGRPADTAPDGPASRDAVAEKPAEASRAANEAAPAARDTPAESSPAVQPAEPSRPKVSEQPITGSVKPPQPTDVDSVRDVKPASAPSSNVAAPPVPEGCISLRVLPIFRLLPTQVLRPGTLAPEEARVALPLSTIDPQLAAGHVEVPLEDFIKALPEELRHTLTPVPGAQVWIPLDEIFQNLPIHHLFYMPPLGSPAEPIQPLAGNRDPGPAPAPATPPAAPSIETAQPADEPPPAPAPAIPEKLNESGTPSAPAPAPTPQAVSPLPEPLPQHSAPATSPEAHSAPRAPEAVSPPQDSGEVPAPAGRSTEPHAEEPTPQSPPMANLPPAEQPPATPAPPSRAPWTRGFQVPPPRLFAAGTPRAEPPSQAAPVEPLPPPAPTPEAKHTADFLAVQPGIFASAAFVQGAVFASADFPRKPDLDALRDFMGAFIDRARENGRRLGWNRVLTIACEQFHLTAVVRDTHFIVALHHDRVLASPTYDALIAAADDLSKAAG